MSWTYSRSATEAGLSWNTACRVETVRECDCEIDRHRDEIEIGAARLHSAPIHRRREASGRGQKHHTKRRPRREILGKTSNARRVAAGGTPERNIGDQVDSVHGERASHSTRLGRCSAPHRLCATTARWTFSIRTTACRVFLHPSPLRRHGDRSTVLRTGPRCARRAPPGHRPTCRAAIACAAAVKDGSSRRRRRMRP